MPVKLRSFTKRFDDEKRDFLGAVLFEVCNPRGADEIPATNGELDEDGVLTRWEGLSPDMRRIYRHRAMEFGRELWRDRQLDDVLKELAPDRPILTEGGGCVWCSAQPASRERDSHRHTCVWVRARLLLGDELE